MDRVSFCVTNGHPERMQWPDFNSMLNRNYDCLTNVCITTMRIVWTSVVASQPPSDTIHRIGNNFNFILSESNRSFSISMKFDMIHTCCMRKSMEIYDRVRRGSL